MYRNCGPEQYAEKIWKSVASGAIMTPLDGLIDNETLQNDVKAVYMQRVLEESQGWDGAAGLENPYTMLWVTAWR